MAVIVLFMTFSTMTRKLNNSELIMIIIVDFGKMTLRKLLKMILMGDRYLFKDGTGGGYAKHSNSRTFRYHKVRIRKQRGFLALVCFVFLSN